MLIQCNEEWKGKDLYWNLLLELKKQFFSSALNKSKCYSINEAMTLKLFWTSGSMAKGLYSWTWVDDIATSTNNKTGHK